MEQTQKGVILVVDDTPENLGVLFDYLDQFGFTVLLVQNGDNALKQAERNHPDLILLDIMMPEMNGYEVCTRLKEMPETRDIPVIFITAMSEARNKTHGFEVGGVDYITKPFHAAEVKARVKTHLSLKSMREELNDQNIILEQKVEQKTLQLQEMLRATIQALGLAGEIRDRSPR